jgi:tetratricopeptide (TPR) repeat protein
MHTAAAAYYRAGNSESAEVLYTEAAEQWAALGDLTRLAAARLGQAEVAWRQGRHADALALARSAQSEAERAGAGYLAARALSQTCLTLRVLGKLAEGAACQNAAIDRYAQLHETSEVASALLSAAAMAREDGRVADLDEVMNRLDEIDASTLTPLVRGRSAHLRSGQALGKGDFGQALALLAEAMSDFEVVRSPLWMAASHLQAARVHAALGSQTEALHLARVAADGFREINAPEREGAAWLLMSKVHAEAGALAPALDAADQAAARYQDAARPQLQLAAAVAALSVDPTARRLEQVNALTQASVERPARLSFSLDLAEARLGVAQGRGELALAQLNSLQARVSDLPSWFDLIEAQAAAEMSLGRPDQARRRLEEAIVALRKQVDAVGSPALAHMAARRLRRLAKSWIDTLTQDEVGDPGFHDQVGNLLLGTHPAAWLGREDRAISGRKADVLRQLLAEVMLPEGREGVTSIEVAEVQRLLWKPPTGDTGQTTNVVQAWGQLRERAVAGDAVLLVGLGRSQAVSLLVDERGSRMWLIPDVTDLLEVVASLRSGAASRAHPVDDLDRIARNLSARLFSSRLGQPPSGLKLFVDDAMAGVPFAMLRWPESESQLVETTRLTHVLPPSGRSNPESMALETSDLRVLFAGVERKGSESLPELRVAAVEADLIASAQPTWNVGATALSLEELRTALESAGSMVHVAGHGSVASGIQGFSGLWASSGADGNPLFISWLELAGSPLRARLLVLNACAMGDSGEGAGEAAANFAQVAQASGVQDVVAALWPVSDSAGAIWVPAFYERLTGEGERVSESLRRAQLRLRGSRSFRHPYYWASLVHWGS